MMFAKYFIYYTTILRGPFFCGHAVHVHIYNNKNQNSFTHAYKPQNNEIS